MSFRSFNVLKTSCMLCIILILSPTGSSEEAANSSRVMKNRAKISAPPPEILFRPVQELLGLQAL
eukprot:CAMPEP_0119159998 /NCGR_PEP_ID=MMETSP1310-20130426/54044_1 /TAXON_ID=464262 /ORGANISM="Genus nov. species nov., Strain RCC2339" /LENGTH=64 /DNA_ID=CAMNT_0007152627 /DNA_START=857 /DNA_END=1050 /DNA_ORIENTATION=-